MIIENTVAITNWKNELLDYCCIDWEDRQIVPFRWTKHEKSLHDTSMSIAKIIQEEKSILIILHRSEYDLFLEHLIVAFCNMKIYNVRKKLLAHLDWINLDMNFNRLYNANILYLIFDEDNPPKIPLSIIKEKNLQYLCYYNGISTQLTEIEHNEM